VPPLLNSGVIVVNSRISSAPSSPTAGARYIINGTPTGVWSTLSFAQHDVVESDGNGSWFRYTPTEGWLAYVEDGANMFIPSDFYPDRCIHSIADIFGEGKWEVD
jgi:hypothetical protein